MPLGQYGLYHYHDLVASFEVEQLVVIDQVADRGDTLALLRDGKRYGFLTFGWGSCPGCDALQLVDDDRVGATKLRDELWSQVHWENDAESMASYLHERDWKGIFLDKQLVSDFLRAARRVLPQPVSRQPGPGL
jgi:hypothetical protein